MPALGEREPGLNFRIKNAEGKQLFESSVEDDGVVALWVAKDLT